MAVGIHIDHLTPQPEQLVQYADHRVREDF